MTKKELPSISEIEKKIEQLTAQLAEIRQECEAARNVEEDTQ